YRLAQPAGHALVLLDEGDLVVVRHRFVLRVDHVDALERADVDAELASRAELLDHLRLRDLLRLHARDVIAVLILDRVDRAIDAADGAVDAALGMDVVLPASSPPYRVRGALDLADAAADALVSDEMGHSVAQCTVLVKPAGSTDKTTAGPSLKRNCTRRTCRTAA